MNTQHYWREFGKGAAFGLFIALPAAISLAFLASISLEWLAYKFNFGVSENGMFIARIVGFMLGIYITSRKKLAALNRQENTAEDNVE